MRSLGADDDGKELRLKVGEAFAVALAETPTTGFRWSLAALPAAIAVEHDAFTPPDSARPGAGGEHRWTFRAHAAGTAALKLELASPSRRDAQPRAYLLRIEVS